MTDEQRIESRMTPDSRPAERPAGLTESLWCVHVLGPDDVYAAPDLSTAVRWAHMLNLLVASRGEHDRHEDQFILCYANVSSWPHSAEDYVRALPKAIADMTPPATRTALTEAGAGR